MRDSPCSKDRIKVVYFILTLYPTSMGHTWWLLLTQRKLELTGILTGMSSIQISFINTPIQKKSFLSFRRAIISIVNHIT